jgi:hypothetical protein
MKYYLRNTHDENGEFRGDDAFLPSRIQYEGLGVHGFDRVEPMNLDDYVNFHRKYADQFPQEFTMPTRERLQLELDELVRVGLAKEIIYE